MYSRQEVSLINQQFWTTLGQYMSPIPSADGEKINWINYKTGEKNIRFAMQAADKQATIYIELSHKDAALQEWYFEKFVQLKKIFQQSAGMDWQWRLLGADEQGKIVSLISRKLDGINILNKEHWPTLISFFKENMLALDEFWCQNKFAFER